MRTVYVALSLTHVKTEEEKGQIRSFLKWLKSEFDIELFTWAFDVETWTPLPVDNIYDYDTDRVKNADLVIALYLTNDGSDGRGGEVVNRVDVVKKPILALVKNGVRVSRYPADCLKKHNIPLHGFENFGDVEHLIRNALAELHVHA